MVPLGGQAVLASLWARVLDLECQAKFLPANARVKGLTMKGRALPLAPSYSLLARPALEGAIERVPTHPE